MLILSIAAQPVKKSEFLEQHADGLNVMIDESHFSNMEWTWWSMKRDRFTGNTFQWLLGIEIRGFVFAYKYPSTCLTWHQGSLQLINLDWCGYMSILKIIYISNYLNKDLHFFVDGINGDLMMKKLICYKYQ